MKFTTSELILIILTLILLIIIVLYVLYNIFYVKEKFYIDYIPNSTSSPNLKSTINKYSNILINDAPLIIKDINTNSPQTDNKISEMTPIINGNILNLNKISLSKQENIDKINSQMDGIFIPVNEKFENIPKTNWRTEWNEKIKIYNNNTINDSSLTDTNPNINMANLETKFYIVNNPNLENNLNETTAEIIAHNFQNISKKIESELLKN
jgi:hypothetical protein